MPIEGWATDGRDDDTERGCLRHDEDDGHGAGRAPVARCRYGIISSNNDNDGDDNNSTNNY